MDDTDTPVTNLVVTAESSDQGLVSNKNIFLLGNGTNRTMIIYPASQQKGTNRITVTVSDGLAKASSAFELKVIPQAKDDFDLDGVSDLVFQDANDYLGVWLMKGLDRVSGVYFEPDKSDAGYRLVGTGDFDHDLHLDLLFQHEAGTLEVWFMRGINRTNRSTLVPAGPGDRRWRLVGTGDFQRDDRIDLLFQHEDGTLAVWLMEGTTLTNGALINARIPDERMIAIGVGDFTGEGRDQILLAGKDRRMAIGKMEGTNWVETVWLKPVEGGDVDWKVVRPVDLNGDKKAELVVERSDQSLLVLSLVGTNWVSGSNLVPSKVEGTWRLIGPALPEWPINPLPIISIVAPTNRQTFLPGHEVVIKASAFDLDGQVMRVDFFTGTNETFSPLGTTTNLSLAGIFAFTWTNAAAGFYTLTAEATDNSGQSTRSAPVMIEVAKPPEISGQPSSQTAPAGTSVTFRVSATGTAPLSYKWSKDGSDITGATNATLVVDNVQDSDSGDYRVVVTNVAGSTESKGAKLAVQTIVRLTISNNNVPESIGTITAIVTKVGTLPGTVRLRLQEGSALAVRGRSGDYFDLTEVDSTLHFERNQSVKEIPIVIVDDYLEEMVETFSVRLEVVDGDLTLQEPASITVSLLDNDAGAFSVNGTNYIRPDWTYPGRGSLSVQISGPDGASASPESRWRFPWDANWRTNKEPLLDLPVGQYPIDWRAVVGQRPPEVTSIEVKVGIPTDRAVSYRVGLTNLGALRLVLDPPDGTAWRIAGEVNMAPLRHNQSRLISLGSHLVEFEERDGYVSPAPTFVKVPLLGEMAAFGRYSKITPIVGAAVPSRLNFAEVTNAVLRGYPFNGQVWSSFGWGSGFAVSDRVILTAAHLVSGFVSETNRQASFLYWFPQRHGTHLPVRPLKAVGWFVPAAYANSGGDRTWDFAAVYFDEPVCPHGWGGYLVSDPKASLHLESSRVGVQLVGYPMDGKKVGLENQVFDHYMHAKRLDLPGSQVFSQFAGYRIIQTTAFRSLAGNSGGPVYVSDPSERSVDLPAGIYLGENAEGAILRAIDRDVVEQILKAKTAANIDTNHCFGGCPPLAVPGWTDVVGLSVVVRPPNIFRPTDGVIVQTKGESKTITLQEFDIDLLVGQEYTIRFPNVAGYETPGAKAFAPKPTDVSERIQVDYQWSGLPKLDAAFLKASNRIHVWISGITNRLVTIEGSRP